VPTPFPFAADWSEPILERLEWLTDVLPSRNDTEQRVRLREGARRSVEFGVALLGNQERTLAENLVRAGQGGLFELPFWPDATQLLVAADSTATVLEVGVLAGLGFDAAGSLMLVDGLRSTLLAIGSVDVGGGTITLEAPLAAGWPAGARVVPAGLARLGERSAMRLRSDAAVVCTLSFSYEDEWLWTPAAEAATYRGYAVLEQQTNWADDPTVEYSRRLGVLDNSVGVPLVTDLSEVQRAARAHSWLLAGRSEIAAFRGWLAARAGRLVPFWLPSLQDDVQLVANVGAAATTLLVANGGRWRLDGTDAAIGRRDLRIVLASGAVLYRRVTAAAQIDSATEQLTIDAALGTEVTPSDVRQISWMPLARLAGDAAEMAYLTDTLAECTLSLASVRDVL
jgi:hypothetical protein